MLRYFSLLFVLMLVAAGDGRVGAGYVAAAYAQTAEARLTDVSERLEREVARLIRATRQSDDPALSRENEPAKPYWNALKSLNEAVAQMSNGAVLQDNTFHTGLSDTVRFAAATIASHALTGAEDDSVQTSLDNVEALAELLEHQFSKDAARYKAGGSLTDEERQKLDALMAKQAELDNRLDAIEPKVANNSRAKASIAALRERSRIIRNSQYRVRDYTSALVAARISDGILFGAWWWWGPWGAWYPAYAPTYIVVVDSMVDDVAYDWAYFGSLDAAVEGLDAEDVSDKIDVAEMSDLIAATDLDLGGGLDAAALVGLDAVTDTDVGNEEFGFLPADLQLDSGALEAPVELELDMDQVYEDLEQSLEAEQMLKGDSFAEPLSDLSDMAGDVSTGNDLGLADLDTNFDGDVPDVMDMTDININEPDFDRLVDFGSDGFDAGFDDF